MKLWTDKLRAHMDKVRAANEAAVEIQGDTSAIEAYHAERTASYTNAKAGYAAERKERWVEDMAAAKKNR